MAIQPEQLKKLEKLAKVLDGGELELFKQLTDLEERVDTVAEQLPALREAKDGVDGVDGYTPVKGKDYFDGYTPIKGVDYFDGVNGRDGKDSTVPGPRGPRGDVGPRGPAGKNGDIKDLSPQEIRDSLELLQGEERLNVSAIDGLEKEVTDRAISIVDNRTSYLINRINNLPTSSSNSGSTAWGGITGTLSEQTDLQNALNAKSDTTHTHTGVYEPADATILKDADIGVTVAPALGSDDNYVTDAEKAALHSHSNKTALDAVSGTNTGDNATNSQYSGLASSKQDTLVSGTNIKTVNGTSLLGSGDVTISAGLTAKQVASLISIRF